MNPRDGFWYAWNNFVFCIIWFAILVINLGIEIRNIIKKVIMIWIQIWLWFIKNWWYVCWIAKGSFKVCFVVCMHGIRFLLIFLLYSANKTFNCTWKNNIMSNCWLQIEVCCLFAGQLNGPTPSLQNSLDLVSFEIVMERKNKQTSWPFSNKYHHSNLWFAWKMK